jgi:hypothetical protein
VMVMVSARIASGLTALTPAPSLVRPAGTNVTELRHGGAGAVLATPNDVVAARSQGP